MLRTHGSNRSFCDDLHAPRKLTKWTQAGVCHPNVLARAAAEYATGEHRKGRCGVPFGQGSSLRKAHQVILDEYCVSPAAQPGHGSYLSTNSPRSPSYSTPTNTGRLDLDISRARALYRSDSTCIVTKCQPHLRSSPCRCLYLTHRPVVHELPHHSKTPPSC